MDTHNSASPSSPKKNFVVPLVVGVPLAFIIGIWLPYSLVSLYYTLWMFATFGAMVYWFVTIQRNKVTLVKNLQEYAVDTSVIELLVYITRESGYRATAKKGRVIVDNGQVTIVDIDGEVRLSCPASSVTLKTKRWGGVMHEIAVFGGNAVAYVYPNLPRYRWGRPPHRHGRDEHLIELYTRLQLALVGKM